MSRKFYPEFYQLPQSLQNLLSEGLRATEAQKIYLFGSRARGQFRDNSDYDFAFEVPEKKQKEWSRFLVDTEENILTLLKVDLVNLSEADPILIDQVQKEGILIYG